MLSEVRAIRLVRPHLSRAGGGSIVNVLATGAKAPAAGSLPSTASRAAGMALTKSFSKELGPDAQIPGTDGDHRQRTAVAGLRS